MTTYNMSYQATIPFSDLTVQFGLAADTQLSYTIPGTSSNSYRVLFSFNINDNIWVGYNVDASAPTPGTITQNSSVERNPDVRFVRGGDILNFVSRAISTDAGFSLLSLP